MVALGLRVLGFNVVKKLQLRRKIVRRSQSTGFTLIELMIVVAIISILTAAGMGMMDGALPRYRTRKVALEFAGHVQQCRNIAVRANRECSIWLIAGDDDLDSLDSNTGEYWVGMGDSFRDSSSWDYLPVDSFEDDSDDDSSEGTIDIGDSDGQNYARYVGIEEWDSISGPNSGNSDRIVFNPRGFISNPDADFGSDGYITITFVNKHARAREVTEDFTVAISRSGMPRVDTSVKEEFSGFSAGTTEASSE